jgi:hypothetical protein
LNVASTKKWETGSLDPKDDDGKATGLNKSIRPTGWNWIYVMPQWKVWMRWKHLKLWATTVRNFSREFQTKIL